MKTWLFAIAFCAAVLAAPAAVGHQYVTLYMNVVSGPGSGASTVAFTYDSDPGPPASYTDAQDGVGYLASYVSTQPDPSLQVTVLDAAGNTISPTGACLAFRITNEASSGGFYELKFLFMCGLDDTAHRTSYVLDFVNHRRGDTLRTYNAGGEIPFNVPLAAFESATFSYSINYCPGAACPAISGGGDVVSLTRGTPNTMSFFGEWNSQVGYSAADVVTHNGVSWVAVVDTTSAEPGTDFNWVSVGASAGAKGATGAQGPAGPEGPPGVAGAVGRAGPRGSPGAVGAQGLVGRPGPAGAPGARGAAGPVGATGATGATGFVDSAALTRLESTLASLARQVGSLNARVAILTSQNSALKSNLQLVATAAFSGLEQRQIADVYVARMEALGLDPRQTLNELSAQLAIPINADEDALLTQDVAQYSAAIHSLQQQISVATAALDSALVHGKRAKALEWQGVLDGLKARLAQVQQGLSNRSGQ
jgi:hypothetical protein